MRNLNIEDVFFLSKMIDELELTDEIMKVQEEALGKENPAVYAGVKLSLIVVKNLHKSKDSILEWLADIKEMTVDEIKKLGFKDLTDLIKEIFANEEIADFFNSLSLEEQN